jgi:hypothetical protein
MEAAVAAAASYTPFLTPALLAGYNFFAMASSAKVGFSSLVKTFPKKSGH